MTLRKTLLIATAAVLPLAGAAVAQTVGTTTTTTTRTITTDEAGQIRTYIQRERRPSVTITEEVRVGSTLAPTTELYSFPESVGVSNYRYVVINGRTALVEPSTRRIIQFID